MVLRAKCEFVWPLHKTPLGDMVNLCCLYIVTSVSFWLSRAPTLCMCKCILNVRQLLAMFWLHVPHSNLRRQVHCSGLHEIRSQDEPRIIERKQIPARPRHSRLHNLIHQVMKIHRNPQNHELHWTPNNSYLTPIKFWIVDDLLHCSYCASCEGLSGDLKTTATQHASHANDANRDGKSCKKWRITRITVNLSSTNKAM